MVSSRLERGAWLEQGYGGMFPVKTSANYSFEAFTRYTPDRPISTVDFRIYTPVIVNLTFLNPHHVLLQDLCVGIRPPPKPGNVFQGASGQEIGSLKAAFLTGSGRYQIYLQVFAAGEPACVLDTIDTHGKRMLNLTYPIPADMNPNASKRFRPPR